MAGLVQHSTPALVSSVLLAVVSGAMEVVLRWMSSEYMITRSACQIAEEKKDADSLDALVALASVYQGAENPRPSRRSTRRRKPAELPQPTANDDAASGQ